MFGQDRLHGVVKGSDNKETKGERFRLYFFWYVCLSKSSMVGLSTKSNPPSLYLSFLLNFLQEMLLLVYRIPPLIVRGEFIVRFFPKPHKKNSGSPVVEKFFSLK